MFERLFIESGLSLDRLRALVEVGASGSIVKAAAGGPVKQSQYSRQIKELEDFFQAHLVERHGKGIRLTAHGRELARISRFFLLGLSNFRRGCLAEEQAFRLGASATFAQYFLAPLLGGLAQTGNVSYSLEEAFDDEIERRLHDLTLDFGVVCRGELSRPLQLRKLMSFRVRLCVPNRLAVNEIEARRLFVAGKLPLALASEEMAALSVPGLETCEPSFKCHNFLQAKGALATGAMAALLPEFLLSGLETKTCLEVCVPKLDKRACHYYFAWNPRLLRLNPHATRKRDELLKLLTKLSSL